MSSLQHKKDMKVSVVIPIYNAAEALPRTLAAAAAQTLDDCEFLLVDDGSTDDSAELCRQAAKTNSRFRFLRQENSGVSVARNRGIAEAQGEYLGFVDSDDLPSPVMFEQLYQRAKETDADMVMGEYRKCRADGSKIPVRLPYDGVLTGEAIQDLFWGMAVWEGYRHGKPLPTLYGSTWPNLYRHALVKQHYIAYPAGVKIGEDLLFNLQFLQVAKRVSIIHAALYDYNLANASATRRRNPNLLEDYLRILTEVRMLLPKSPSREEKTNLCHQMLAYAINVIEEQSALCADRTERKKLTHSVCHHPAIHRAAAYSLWHGYTWKRRLQATLFFLSCERLLNRWIIDHANFQYQS